MTYKSPYIVFHLVNIKVLAVFLTFPKNCHFNKDCQILGIA